MAMKPTDILNMYHVGQIYMLENTVAKKPTGYMFIQNIEQGPMLKNLNV